VLHIFEVCCILVIERTTESGYWVFCFDSYLIALNNGVFKMAGKYKRNKLNHIYNKPSGFIDDGVKRGMSNVEMAKVWNDTQDTKMTLAFIRKHVSHLRDAHGLNITEATNAQNPKEVVYTIIVDGAKSKDAKTD
jgi:hypothetical protein